MKNIMLKKILCFCVITCVCIMSFAQKDSIPVDFTKGDYVLSHTGKETIKERDRSSQILRSLKDGCIIVRLKTNQKSVDAYRNSGRAAIADRIEAERKKLNQNLYKSFTDFFKFCRVYFIYANETKEFQNGNRKIFLNEKLEHDTSIIFKDSFFLFCEYGSAIPYSNYQFDYNPGAVKTDIIEKPRSAVDTLPIQTSTDAATNSSLVLYDKNLQQLARPFPYAEGVYLDNFGASVRSLDREIEKAYYRLVLNRDMQDSIKKMKQKMKEQK